MGKLRVIFVHGGFHKVVDWDYSEKLRLMLLKQLKRLGVIPQRASQGQIDDIITFEQVNYSSIGHEIQETIMDAVTEQRDQLYSFVTRLSRVFWLDEVRRQIVGGYGDVFLYRSGYWGEQIRNMLLEVIEPYVNTDDEVTIFGHSLGSQVAFDTLYHNVRYNQVWQAAKFRPTNLFTMGSPIALFSYDVDRDLRENPPPQLPVPMVRDEGYWYNFLDAQDVVAYPLEVLFHGKFMVNDILVQTGNTPMKAHGGYWNNDELSQIVAQRLKDDFERMHGVEVMPDSVPV